MGIRIEQDLIGTVEVSDDVYWGIQTQRSLTYFNAGTHKMPASLIHYYGWIKRAAAEVNCELGVLDAQKKEWIVEAAREVADGKWMHHFPLYVWQTGSGTHTNMNVNEVIANRAIELAGGVKGSKHPIHPNDHVNCSQSSNDSFPTAMSLAAVMSLRTQLLPSLRALHALLLEKAATFHTTLKIGRTHLMDATPLSLGQEFSGYADQIAHNIVWIESTLPALSELAIGGTAVGTGIAAPPQFGQLMAEKLSHDLGVPFVSAPNKFSAIAAHDPFVFAHGALKTLAAALIKLATDTSWMVSGPTCGLHELLFHANEPGSSIMAGKVNPTQCEALTMICVQVFGNDTSVAMAGSRGNFELNVLKPLIIHNFLESVLLLTDGCSCFAQHFLKSLTPNHEQLSWNVAHSLMLVTALIPKIGYDNAAKIARHAEEFKITLKEAAIHLGILTAEDYDALL